MFDTVQNTYAFLFLIVFNAATICIMRAVLKDLNLVAAVSEKSAGSSAAGETSYSRVAGMIGAVVLATFFWGFGNVVIYQALTAPDKLKLVIEGIAGYVLGGASLFLPYATNQLREAFAAKPAPANPSGRVDDVGGKQTK